MTSIRTASGFADWGHALLLAAFTLTSVLVFSLLG